MRSVSFAFRYTKTPGGPRVFLCARRDSNPQPSVEGANVSIGTDLREPRMSQGKMRRFCDAAVVISCHW